MAGSTGITGIELRLPLVEESKRCRRVADFITEIIGDAAISVNVQEVLAELFREEPGGDGKIFVMRSRELAAVVPGFFDGRGKLRNRVSGGQTRPARGSMRRNLSGRG
jgi:hypothetical protein